MITKLFDEYREHYENKSNETLDSYETSVKQYYDFMMEKYDLHDEMDIINKSTWNTVTIFRNSLTKKGLSPYSVNVRISGLRGFFRFLVLSHIINENPAEQVEQLSTNSVEQTKDFLTEDEYKLLIKTIKTPSGKKQDKFAFTSARDAFFVGLLIVGGFRISEALNMTVDQIDMKNKKVTVLGKGSKLRTVSLNDSVIKLMNDYLKERKQINTTCDNLFVNIKGGKMSRQGTNQNLTKYCERAGIDKNITNHSLRHSCITSMVSHGIPVAKVQVMVGHSDSAITSRYYRNHLDTTIKEEFLPELD